MNKNFRYYLIYFAVFILAVSLAGGLQFAYDFSLLGRITDICGSKLSFWNYVIFISEFLLPIVITFLSAFTIYSCAVGAVTSMICGMKLGVFAIEYATSGLNPFTHAVSLVFIIAYSILYTYLSTSSALYRASLRYAAPDPRELLRLKCTSSLFKLFICIAAGTITMSTALYFFLVYFPIN